MEVLGLPARKLGNGMVAFGIAGLVVTIILVVSWLGGLIALQDLDDRLEADRQAVAAALVNTAALMDSTAATLEEVTGSMGNMGAALTDAADLLDRLASTTASLADSLNVSILGQQPFEGASRNLESIATDLETFAGHSAALAEDLEALEPSIGALAADLRTVQESVEQPGRSGGRVRGRRAAGRVRPALRPALRRAGCLAGGPGRGLHLGRTPAPAGRSHRERRVHPHQLIAPPATTVTAPSTTQVRLPVMKLDDTMTFRPWRIQTNPASATRTPTITTIAQRIFGW